MHGGCGTRGPFSRPAASETRACFSFVAVHFWQLRWAGGCTDVSTFTVFPPRGMQPPQIVSTSASTAPANAPTQLQKQRRESFLPPSPCPERTRSQIPGLLSPSLGGKPLVFQMLHSSGCQMCCSPDPCMQRVAWHGAGTSWAAPVLQCGCRQPTVQEGRVSSPPLPSQRIIERFGLEENFKVHAVQPPPAMSRDLAQLLFRAPSRLTLDVSRNGESNTSLRKLLHK